MVSCSPCLSRECRRCLWFVLNLDLMKVKWKLSGLWQLQVKTGWGLVSFPQRETHSGLFYYIMFSLLSLGWSGSCRIMHETTGRVLTNLSGRMGNGPRKKPWGMGIWKMGLIQDFQKSFWEKNSEICGRNLRRWLIQLNLRNLILPVSLAWRGQAQVDVDVT